MASHIWIGGAPAIAQVDSVTFPSDVAAGQIVNFVIGVKTLSYTLTGANQLEIIAEVVDAWNASTIPEYAEITASVGLDSNDLEDGTMKLTAKTAGKPFAVTVSIGSGNNEIQVITLGGTPATGGDFTLTFDGQTTAPVAHNASDATIKSALELLSNIDSVTVTGADGGPWTVEFTGTLAGTNVALMTINVDNLTGGVNEVQTISSPSNPTGGTFTLSYGGQATDPIAYNASAATIQTRLEALSTIPTGSVACAGGALPGTPVTVTFQDELAAMNVVLLKADASGLTGVTGNAVETQAGGSGLKDKALYHWSFNAGTEDSGNSFYPFTDSIASAVLRGGNATYSFNSSTFHVAGGIDGKCLGGGSYAYSVHDSNVASFDENVAFSIALWVKPSSLGSRTVLAIRHSQRNDISDYPTTNDTNYDYALTMEPGGTVKFDMKKTGGFHTNTTAGTLTLNTWNLVVAIWDPDNTTLSIGLNGGALDSAAGLTVGTATSSSTRYFSALTQTLQSLSGFLDDVTIFNGALTLADTQTIYNSGSGDFYPFPTDGNNELQTLTLTGSPTAGNVIVSYQGEGVNIPYNSTAAAAETLLDTVSTIGSGNTNVTGGPWPGTPLVVEFINDLALTDVELLDIDTSALTMLVSETTPGVTAPTGKVETTVSPLTKSTTIASEGPNHWDTPANWNTNTVPVSSDTVYLTDSLISILYGIDQSAITLAYMYVDMTFEDPAAIGLPPRNTDGAISYAEYRDQYLKIGVTNLIIGKKEGVGSGRIKIDLGAVQSTVLITDSGDGEDANTPAILLLGTHASNVIDINRGSLGVAYYPTEVSTIATLRQAFFDDAADDTTVYLGDGVTITDIIKSGGVLDINSNTTSLDQTAGTTTIHAGAHTLLNIQDGLLNYNSVGTLSEINLSGESVLIFDQDSRPKTVTIINKFTDESEIFDVSKSITNRVVDCHNCGDLSTLNMGKNFKLTFGAIT